VASPKSSRKVVASPAIARELKEIWRWNADNHGIAHANFYVDSLRQAIRSLQTKYEEGGLIAGNRDLRYLLVRRKKKGHGHVVVYRVGEEIVHVLHIFHTAQDWRSKARENFES
jgi:plasmid stabilization system protein ParE